MVVRSIRESQSRSNAFKLTFVYAVLVIGR